jgi:cell wall-associated NlpC family hydrolase
MATVTGALVVNAAPGLAGSAAGCGSSAKAGFARVQPFAGPDCKGASVIVPKTGDANRPSFAAFRNYDGSTRDVDNGRSSVAPPETRPEPPAPAPPAVAAPKPPASSNQSAKVLTWAYRHVSWWAGLYSMPHRLPTNVSVKAMQTTEPPRGRGTPRNVKQGCDCSSFVRWAVAQAGIDVGTYTGELWTGNGGKIGPLKPTNRSVDLSTGHAARGWGNLPPGGYHPGDLIFYGVTNMTPGIGHVALYMGKSKIVQCSGNRRGSNMGRSVTSPGSPTGWVRYDRVSG